MWIKNILSKVSFYIRLFSGLLNTDVLETSDKY